MSAVSGVGAGRLRVAVVTPLMKSGERGGAEALYEGMIRALRQAGHTADQVGVEVDESSFDAILESYATCQALDLRDYDLVVSTKAPTYMVQHPCHVSYLVHTIRVFYDMFEREYGTGTLEQRQQRRLIHELDRRGLGPGNVRRHCAIGRTPVERLYDADAFWRGVEFEVLPPPPLSDRFKAPRAQEHVLLPGRLHRWKRPDLVIRAFRHLRRDVPLKVVGTGEDELALRALAADDPRVEFLGRVADEDLLDLYASALVVPFVPVEEDYGLITIEAFRSSKPVITCRDSGEPTSFVRDGENGFVVDPDPAALADRLAYLVDHPGRAANMGRRGAADVEHITWERVVAGLTAVAQPGARAEPSGRPYPLAESTPRGGPAADSTSVGADDRARFPVTVLDMQPIDPPLGGGRARLLGLYHALGERLPTTYRGTYDWPGERQRQQRLSPTLEERLVPLSDAHFAAAEEWKRRAGGKTVIDVAFPQLGPLSAEFVASARQGVAEAEIVVFSHPWVYPLVKDDVRRATQLLVYESHNVEGYLRATLLDDRGFGTELVRHAIAAEYELCAAADLILACSHADRALFHELYGLPLDKILVVPNGTFAERGGPVDEQARRRAKQRIGLGERSLAVFLGSAYGPNVEAATYIGRHLAPALPEVTFAIIGGAGTELPAEAAGLANLRATGTISDEEKRAYLAAADLALNPMFAGSGTAVKMFDFMAAGLPIVTTAVGARGIATGSEPPFEVVSPAGFVAAVRGLLADRERADRLGTAARQLVRDQYAWERISPALGRRLHREHARRSAPRPLFSVIIPTYERQAQLDQVLACLAAQTFRDFEVILVDQSRGPWRDAGRPRGLDLLYLHLDVKGAVNARNTGAFHARGRILAFTDDDCQPRPDWLASARRYFDDPQVVGVEGLLESDRRDDPAYRAVTNVGFEGIGFMTANLLIRRDTFAAIDGFDLRFDHPHFREDTDLGWRASALGRIPFGHDVRVYHPPHRREIERESQAERNRFFEKDALLLAKHPERYRELFVSEGHYRRTAGFREHFLRGARKYGVEVDGFYLSLLGSLDREATRGQPGG